MQKRWLKRQLEDGYCGPAALAAALIPLLNTPLADQDIVRRGKLNPSYLVKHGSGYTTLKRIAKTYGVSAKRRGRTTWMYSLQEIKDHLDRGGTVIIASLDGAHWETLLHRKGNVFYGRDPMTPTGKVQRYSRTQLWFRMRCSYGWKYEYLLIERTVGDPKVSPQKRERILCH